MVEPVHVQRKPDGMVGPEGSSLAVSLPRVAETPCSSMVEPLHLQRSLDGLAATEGSCLAEFALRVVETPHISMLKPLNLRRISGGMAPIDEPGAIATRHEFEPPSAQGKLPNYAGLPLDDPQLRREFDPLPMFASNQVAHKIETDAAPSAPNTSAQSGSVVTKEISAAALLPDSKRMVWRKPNSDEESSSPSSPTEEPGTDFTSQRLSESGSDNEVSPVTTATSRTNGVDVTGIAERVTRMIARQLLLERERRGIPR